MLIAWNAVASNHDFLANNYTDKWNAAAAHNGKEKFNI
jgi:hypothetical protein